MLPFIRYYYCLIFNFIKQPLLCHIQFFKRVIDLNTPGLKYLEWIPLSTELNQTPSLDFGKLHLPSYHPVPHYSLGTMDCSQFLDRITYFHIHKLEILFPLSLKNSIYLQGSEETLPSLKY